MTVAWTDKTKRKDIGVALAERVEEWQGRLGSLGVGHFFIDEVTLVDETPGGPGAVATVQASRDYEHCHWWFRWSYLENCSSDALDQTILHEWVHVAMRDLDRTMDQVEKWMPEATYELYSDLLDSERESLVDRLAHTLFVAFNGRPARFHG